MKSIKKTLFWLFCATFAALFGFGAWYLLAPFAFDRVLEEENTLEISQKAPNNEDIQPNQDALENIQNEVGNRNNPASFDDNIVEHQENQPKEAENTEKMPEEEPQEDIPAQKIYQGNIETIDIASSGSFTVYQQGKQRFLWIEDLVTDNGPDLFLVFSNQKPAWGNRDYEIIAPLPANRGSFMVEIPPEVDPADFQHLLIHCRLFAHTFAGGMLGPVEGAGE